MARQADPETHPGLLAAWMAPFAGCFTRPTWANMLVLVAGAVLSPGRRTVASALSSVRNVSTTLIQPGLEFRLGLVA